MLDDSERQLAEARDRGYLSHVLVEINGNDLYPVFFYSIDRLAGELRLSSKEGQPFIAETGMIVLPEIDIVGMQNAVQRLCDEGYFEYLVPLPRERLAEANPFYWPP